MEFRVSSFCNWVNCVDVGTEPGGPVVVRRRDDPDQTGLVFTRDEWAAFVHGVKAGEFDLP